MALKVKKVAFKLPFEIGMVEWEVDKTQRLAAWSLYIELVTRIAIQPIDPNEGLAREALNSLYSIFGSTREILKAAGPDAGISKASIGGIAIRVLNNGLRPFLSKWHPKLLIWEAGRDPATSAKEHELKWPEEKLLRSELENLRSELAEYADALAKIAGVN